MASGSFAIGRKSVLTGEPYRTRMPRIVIQMDQETFDAINKAAAEDSVPFAAKARELLRTAVSQ